MTQRHSSSFQCKLLEYAVMISEFTVRKYVLNIVIYNLLIDVILCTAV